MGKLISCKPALWDVTEAYCKKITKPCAGGGLSSPAKMQFILKMELTGPPPKRKELTVDINGFVQIYALGKKNEYYANGQSLTKTLEIASKGKGNKIKIL